MTQPQSSPAASAPLEGSGAMFDGIAVRYDLLNRILSLGIDQRWRRRTAAALEHPSVSALSALADPSLPGEPRRLRSRIATGCSQVGAPVAGGSQRLASPSGEPLVVAGGSHAPRFLDLATGTGDLALAVLERFPDARVVGLDPSRRMLEVAASKSARLGKADRIELTCGDAQALPFPDASFDGVCMGFGIRNVPDRRLALREIRRVLRGGGHVAILELSEPRSGLLGPLARFHVRTVVPWIGALLSGSREYRYLQRSIAAFPEPSAFVAMMQDAGLARARAERLSFGACHLYVAESPA